MMPKIHVGMRLPLKLKLDAMAKGKLDFLNLTELVTLLLKAYVKDDIKLKITLDKICDCDSVHYCDLCKHTRGEYRKDKL